MKSIISYYESVIKDSDDFSELYDFCNLPEYSWVEKEADRLEEMYHAQCMTVSSQFRSIAGVDEVGRGPMAGPVVAAAVVFGRMCFLPGLNDSKKVAEPVRNYLCSAIKRCAVSYAIGIVESDEIDRINIHNASLLAMKKAVNDLDVRLDFLIVDGRNRVPGISCRQFPVVRGDSKIYSVAAASILAKVTRDAIMIEYDKIYPGYNFTSHKGYCTKDHVETLRRLGPLPIHRKCYAPVKRLKCRAEQLVLT